MRFGYCVNMIAEDAEGVGYGWIETLKKTGYDYVELPLAQLSAMEERDIREKIVRPMRDQDLPCLAMNNFFPATHRLTGPSADHDKALAYAARALDLAAGLGAGVVVFGSAGARNAPDGANTAACFRQLVDFLGELSGLAHARGVDVAIEHLNRMEANLINTFAEGLVLARAAHAPGIGVLTDYYHMRMVSESFCMLDKAGMMLKHVHIARPLGRETPRHGDMEPYAAFFELLEGIGYDGTVSVEAYLEKGKAGMRMQEALDTLRSSWQENARE